MSAVRDDHDAKDPVPRPPPEASRLLPGGGPSPAPVDVRPAVAAATGGWRGTALSAAVPMLALAGVYLAWRSSSASALAPRALFGLDERRDTEEAHDDGHGDDGGDEHGEDQHSTLHTDPYAVLFPWFAQLIGLVVYIVLSRYAHGLPFTAVIFVAGLAFGVLAGRSAESADDELLVSIRQWTGINGEVLLLVFLPGLLYLDSFSVDAHIFFMAFWQLVTFAFPMVLAGTTLTALVLKFVLPYDFPFDFCMMTGAVLAATDPVAVAVLLNELGAPARLKVHISGESLLNDGSAFVFFTIFKMRYLFLLGVDDLGEDVGWGRGVVLFIQLAFGGAAIGLAFGLGECAVLFALNRRLSGEENVLQVASTIMTAYLAFFTSEIAAGCSGIVAVVVCGVTVKTFGETLHNDVHLTHDFWHITEHLLNTLLFFLAGALLGGSFSDQYEHSLTYMSLVWLLVLFLFAIAIRFALVFLFFPLTSRMGIGQSWQEAVFMSYGGLRGAVGIALAISVYEEVVQTTRQEGFPEDKRGEFNDQVSILFLFTGGIAFLTLVINGPTAGPLLKKLGLVTPTPSREKVVENYEQHMKQHTLIEYLKILAQPRFGDSIDYAVIRCNVSPLRHVTERQLADALAALRKKHPGYRPNLKNLLPYLVGARGEASETSPVAGSVLDAGLQQPPRAAFQQRSKRGTVYDLRKEADVDLRKEQRRIFINLLRTQYHHQIKAGELESRGCVPISLLHCLQKADDAAQDSGGGAPLATWRLAQSRAKFGKAGERALHTVRRTTGDRRLVDVHYTVLMAIAHIHAHEAAQRIFKEEFSQVGAESLTASEKAILDESKADIREAELTVAKLDSGAVHITGYQWVGKVLLSKSAQYFEQLLHAGLMTEKEASGFLEKLEHEMSLLVSAEELESEGPIDARGKLECLEASAEELASEVKECQRDLKMDISRHGGSRMLTFNSVYSLET